MNKDQVKGRIAEATGKAKDFTGMVFSEDLQNRGKVQNALGKLQATYGDLKENVKKTLKPE